MRHETPVLRYRHDLHEEPSFIGVDLNKMWVHHVVADDVWGTVEDRDGVTGPCRRYDLEDFPWYGPTVPLTFQDTVTDPDLDGGLSRGWQIGVRVGRLLNDKTVTTVTVTSPPGTVDCRWSTSVTKMLRWRKNPAARLLVTPRIRFWLVERCRPVTVQDSTVVPSGAWTSPGPWAFRTP